jgi:nucleotide-binding universal stress UspA family protein
MKIMVAFDGSELSRKALAESQKRAKALNAELHLFTAAGNGNGNGNGDKVKPARMNSGLKDAEMMCKACGIDCKIEMSDEKLTPAQAIVKYATENHIDEIVIGLRKRSQIGKLLFGSTSRQVILEAPCPVLTVK